MSDDHYVAVPDFHDAYFASASSSGDSDGSSGSSTSSLSSDEEQVLTHLNQQEDNLTPKAFPDIDTSKYRPQRIPHGQKQAKAPHPPKSPYIQEGQIHRAFLHGGSPETPAMAALHEKTRKAQAKAIKKAADAKQAAPTQMDFEKIQKEREATHQAFKKKYVDEGELTADLLRKGYVKKDDPDSAAIAMDMYRRQLKDEERARRKMVGQDDPILELPVPPLTMKRDEDKDLLRHMAEKDLMEYERR